MIMKKGSDASYQAYANAARDHGPRSSQAKETLDAAKKSGWDLAGISDELYSRGETTGTLPMRPADRRSRDRSK
jgi:hypothetical protein